MDVPLGPAAVVADSDGRAAGSAFRISNSLLLTALHVLNDDESPQVQLLGGDDFLECKIVWKGDINDADLDIAILRINDTKNNMPPSIEPVSIGQFVGTGRRDCEATGYLRDPDERLIARRLIGIIDPGAYPGANFLVLELSRSFQPLGFAGAGACSEGKLIGIITRYNRDEGTIRLTPITKLIENTSFRQTIRSDFKHDLEVVQLVPTEADVTSAIKGVSKADPRNIQEVAAASFDLSNSYYANVLSQAQRSFNAAVVAGIIGSLFFLAAIVFALTSKQLSASLISSIGGATVEVVSGLNFWLYSRTASQLNSFHLRLERMQRYLVANSVAASLEGEHRESTLEKLVMAISEGNPASSSE